MSNVRYSEIKLQTTRHKLPKKIRKYNTKTMCEQNNYETKKLLRACTVGL